MTQTISNGLSAFSPDYVSARERFRSAALAGGFTLESLSIGLRGPEGEDLTIDAARLGPEAAERALVVSSGLHGVEGFLGSAVQQTLLESKVHEQVVDGGAAILLLHALDPYGFAWTRRFDEQNVDLNRNFLINGEPYQGSPAAYRQLNGLLNPAYAPARIDTFWPRALLALAWYGRRALRQAVAHGQYDYPRGIFFGGQGRSRAYRILQETLPRWLGSVRDVIHVDFHTGLGAWGTYKLLVDPGISVSDAARLSDWFGPEAVQISSPAGIAYTTKGDLGPWCQSLFPRSRYDYLCAEFGTYSPLTVVWALRWENQTHHWGEPADTLTRNAKSWLREAFAPADPGWRVNALHQGAAVVNHALAALGRRERPVNGHSQSRPAPGGSPGS